MFGMVVIVFCMLARRLLPGSGPGGNGEIEDRAFSRLRFHPDAPAVFLDNALGDRQAEPVAREVILFIYPFKQLEQARRILRGNANTVVEDGEGPFRASVPG